MTGGNGVSISGRNPLEAGQKFNPEAYEKLGQLHPVAIPLKRGKSSTQPGIPDLYCGSKVAIPLKRGKSSTWILKQSGEQNSVAIPLKRGKSSTGLIYVVTLETPASQSP